MIKLVFCVRRRADIDEAEFHRYWRDAHGPLVASKAEVLGILRYVQVHLDPAAPNAMLAETRGAPEPYDGLAELWFASSEALLAAATSEEGLRAGAVLLEDEQRFIDHARSPLFLAQEHVVVDTLASPGAN
jgi:uncharacterized protein (TIGR02118 family)